MGKKNKPTSSLGRSLIKDRFGGAKNRKFVDGESMLHTTEIQDGYDWGRLNLQSVTEESSFQEFLSTAELAGTEFQAEKLNIKFVNPQSNIGLLTKEELKKAAENQNRHKEFIKIPRRPPWTKETTPEQLQQSENDGFLEWRRSLARLQEEEGLLLTPYEKNLEFWRQLWRVVEKSDVVVQIVDARNPLLFRCEDLETYVGEVSEHKMNVVLINKADFLTDEQRRIWAEYFTSIGVKVAFFSAIAASESIEETDEGSEGTASEDDEEAESEGTTVEAESEETTVESNTDSVKASVNKLEQEVDRVAERLSAITESIKQRIGELESGLNSSELLTREGLIEFFRTVHAGPKVTPGLSTIGLVGYPNVGKSSTINALMQAKKVSVSATPGKTKHFQTLYLDKDILLCDCPGLVMPSFVYTKAEMITNGILPIDQMRDHVPPVNLVCNLIPRHVIEDKYRIMLPLPLEGEDETRPPTAEELLNSYGYNRGFMTANGQPDNPRSARYVLKDFMNGKLLYCYAPPNMEQTAYHTWPERVNTVSENHKLPPREVRVNKPNRITTEELDKVFFRTNQQGVHAKGKLGKPFGIPSSMARNSPHSAPIDATTTLEKPWKKINRHENKKKREKLRRVYAHLDQH